MKISDSVLTSLFGLNGTTATSIIDGRKYWLELGEVITFTSCRQTFDNAEFQINNSPYWTIWFSQLSGLFYNGDFDGTLDLLQGCSIQMKNSFQIPSRMSSSEFWNVVKGKRFKVVGVTHCYKPNKYNNEVKRMSIFDVYKKVHNALVNGRGYEVRDLLMPAKCYDLIEI